MIVNRIFQIYKDRVDYNNKSYYLNYDKTYYLFNLIYNISQRYYSYFNREFNLKIILIFYLYNKAKAELFIVTKILKNLNKVF